jgi:hypothetical protein
MRPRWILLATGAPVVLLLALALTTRTRCIAVSSNPKTGMKTY